MQQAMQWDDLRYFLAVERAKTLTSAAAKLGVDATTVGRRIERLAQSLDTELFETTARGHALTPAGEQLLRHAEEIERAVLTASSDLSGENRSLSGTVRLSLSEGLATSVIAPQLGSFVERYPDISLEIVTTNGFLNPSKREADIAVMLARPTQGLLITSRLSDYRLGLYASRDYIAKHGAPETLADLRHHRLLGYVPEFIYADELRYMQDIDPDLSYQLTSTSINIQQVMAKAGLGIAVLHNFMITGEQDLVPVLADEVVITRSFWLVVHQEVRRLSRVSAVIDWLKDVVSKTQL